MKERFYIYFLAQGKTRKEICRLNMLTTMLRNSIAAYKTPATFSDLGAMLADFGVEAGGFLNNVCSDRTLRRMALELDEALDLWQAAIVAKAFTTPPNT